MKLLPYFLFALLWLLPAHPARAQSDILFEQATTAYNDGDFHKAISIYEEILSENQHSAALYFNLGNAHYKLGEIAPSIYYYEKALLLDPNDPEIRNNLGFARNMTLDAIQPLPETDLKRLYDKLIFFFSQDTWAYLGVGFMLLFVAGYLLFMALQLPNQKRVALIGGAAALFLSLASTAMAYLQYRAYRADRPAIVFDEVVAARSEPNPRSTEAFVLHEGTKVQLLDTLDTWQKVELADGQTGWMPRNSLKPLKDF